MKLRGNRVIKVGSVLLALDPSDKCRRWLTRDCDLLSQNWALTRSKAKHLVPAPQAQAGSQSTHISPPVSNPTGLSLLSFTSQQKQSGEEFLLPTNLPTRWEGGARPIQTSVIIIFPSQPLTALLQFILHTVHPFIVGNCRYGAYRLRRHA